VFGGAIDALLAYAVETVGAVFGGIWRLLATLQGHTGTVWGVALTGDGRTMASGGIDGMVRMWEVGSGACLRTLRNDRRCERLDITGLTGVTDAQRAALLALGAVEVLSAPDMAAPPG
jgi:WD40 repeat protein